MSDLDLHPEAVDAALLLFEGVELLDFAGPYEILAAAGRPDGPLLFRVRSAGVGTTTCRARSGPTLVADLRDDELLATPPAIVVVPGGVGVRTLLDDDAFVGRLAALHARGTIVTSVCTGAWLLAKARLLDDREATTHHLGMERLRTLAPSCRVRDDRRVVDAGSVVTSAGISAGIELGLHLVARSWDRSHADATARYVEWPTTDSS